jgi:hypothetical protein
MTYCANEKEIFVIKHLLSNYSNNCSCYLNPGHKIIIDNYKCLDKCSNDENYKYEYNNKCYQSCPKRTKISLDNITCEDIKCNDNSYFNYNQTGCIEAIPIGYYLNDTELNTIDRCNNKCDNCTSESNKKNFCISCNIYENYYSKINDNSNKYPYINCYNETLDGYFLEDNIYNPCFNICKKCSGFGNEINNNCSECISGYEFKNDSNKVNNCYKICKNYYYFDSNEKYHCTSEEKCPIEYSKLIEAKRKCISNCSKDNIYKYEYNNTCYESCPNNTYISSEKELFCEKKIDKNNLEGCNPKYFFQGLCKIVYNQSDSAEQNIIKDIILVMK